MAAAEWGGGETEEGRWEKSRGIFMPALTPPGLGPTPKSWRPPNLLLPPFLVLFQAPDLLQEAAPLLAQPHDLLIGISIVLFPSPPAAFRWGLRFPHPRPQPEPHPVPGGSPHLLPDPDVSHRQGDAGGRWRRLPLLGSPLLSMAGHRVLGREGREGEGGRSGYMPASPTVNQPSQPQSRPDFT